MDTSHILKPTATVNYSLFNKAKRFLSAMLLANVVLGNTINVFIENLNRKGLLGLGDDFRANTIIWGDGIWLNLLRLCIIAFTSGIFGFLFGYFSHKVTTSDRVVFSTLYVFIGFFFIALASLIVEFFFPDFSSSFNQVMSVIVYSVTSSTFNMIIVILYYIVTFVSAFYFMKSGSRVISDPYYTSDKTENGTFLDIKWYHYLWLFIPISFYSQIILNLIYAVGHTVVTLIMSFKWSTIFGGTDSKGQNALEVAWGKLFWIFMGAVLVVYLMEYLRKILIGETNQHWLVKALIGIAISIVVPILIFWLTPIAG